MPSRPSQGPVRLETREFDRVDLPLNDAVVVSLIVYRYPGSAETLSSGRAPVPTTSPVALDIRRRFTNAPEAGGLTPGNARILAEILVAAADEAEAEQGRRAAAEGQRGAPPPRRDPDA